MICGGLVWQTAGASGAVVISAARVGRVFYSGEPIRLFITADGPEQEASFDVTDYDGLGWYTGSAVVGSGKSTLIEMARRFPFGWYRLRLDMSGGTVEDAFCVLPRCIDGSRGDHGLFGLQVTTTDERQYAAAAQAGIRCLRTDVPWPSCEPEEGSYNLEFLMEQVRLCKKYGMQLMVTLGYTPAWTGVRPVNGPDDWISQKPFVWHPRDLDRWSAFASKIVSETKEVTVQWPSSAVLPEVAAWKRQRVPVVQSWEVWNEADHCFYMGSWGRYLDLLRVLSCTVKRELPGTPVIYGGATGNWYCMCITCANQAPAYFDRMAAHPDGEVSSALGRWYRGMYQLPWIDGYPRENCLNEAYLRYRETGEGYGDHEQQPGDLYRVTAQLMLWNQDSHFRSSCLHQWVAQPGDTWAHNAMLLEKNGGLVPTPLYAALAAARYWLSDAAYVGPVDVGEGAEAHLLLKRGRPLLIAWSDSGAQASIRLQEDAERITPMGRNLTWIRGKSVTRSLERAPLMVLGADAGYLDEALRNRYELFAHTQFGVEAGDALWYGVDELMDDAKNWCFAGFEQVMQQAIEQAGQALATGSSDGPAAVEYAMKVCQGGMLTARDKCIAEGSVAPRAIATIYRLARMQEWLGAVADGRSELWTTFAAEARDVRFYINRVRLRRAQLARGDGDAEPLFAAQMLDCAERQLQRAQETGRRGALLAAQSEIWAGERLMDVQQPTVRRVFIVAELGTAVQLRKAQLLEADASHAVVVRVYNFLERAVTGRVRASIPATWEAVTGLEASFSVAAESVSDVMTLQFRVPGGPPPWEKATPPAPEYEVSLEVPPGLEPTAEIALEGQLEDGSPLMRMLYPVYVGRLCESQEPAGTAEAGTMGVALIPPIDGRTRSVFRVLGEAVTP